MVTTERSSQDRMLPLRADSTRHGAAAAGSRRTNGTMSFFTGESKSGAAHPPAAG